MVKYTLQKLARFSLVWMLLFLSFSLFLIGLALKLHWNLLSIVFIIAGDLFVLYGQLKIVISVFLGKTIDHKLLSVALPAVVILPIAINNGWISIFFRNASSDAIEGTISVLSKLNHNNRYYYKEFPNAKVNLAGFGRRTARDIKSPIYIAISHINDDLVLHLELDWEYLNTATTQEQRIPENKELNVEILVKSSA